MQNYIPDSPIEAEAAFIVAGNWTNAELDALEAELRQAIADAQQAQADAEAAKEEFVQKAEMLEDVAKETTSQEIKQLIINEGIPRAQEYAAEIREIIGDWTI